MCCSSARRTATRRCVRSSNSCNSVGTRPTSRACCPLSSSPPRLLPLEPMTGGLQCQDVAGRAEAGDLTKGNIRQVRLPAEGLAAMDIGQMHLNDWYAHGQNRIADSHTGMGIGPRIDDEQRCLCATLLNTIDQGPFVVGLEGLQLIPCHSGTLQQVLIDFCQ